MSNTVSKLKRPTRKQAERAIRELLREEGLLRHSFTMIEDGEDDWAFWIRQDDTTSYVHPNLAVEWYGTQAVVNQ